MHGQQNIKISDNFVGGIERRKCQCYSKAAAIVEPQQLMDHVDISSTVDITDAFRVAGEATADMPSCLGFLAWYVGKGH